VKYYESLAIEVMKPGAVSGAVRSRPSSGEAGRDARGMAARQSTVTATVTAIDKKKGTITLKGPRARR